jgi:hypothetical protein
MGKASGCLGWGLMGLIGLAGLGMLAGQAPSPQTAQIAAPRLTPAEERAQQLAAREALAAAQVTLTVNRWTKGGFGSVAEVDLTLTNTTMVTLKDAVIRCEFAGESGTVIARVERTAFRNIEPGKPLRIRDLNFGFVAQEARRMSCAVVGVS